MLGKAKGFTAVVVGLMVLHFASTVVNGELMLHWKLDETGGLRVSDSSGNGYDGTLVGGVSFDKDSVEGVLGNALHLDGDQDRIIMDSFSLPTRAFTISFWLSFDKDLARDDGRKYLMFWMGPTRPAGDKPIIVANKGDTGLLRYYFSVGDKQHYVNSRIKNWKGSTWHHLAVTYDYYSAKFYVDGVLEISEEHNGKHFASSGVSFGARPEGGSGLQGKMDDIRIYSHVLSAAEIGDLAGLDPAPAALRTVVSQAAALTSQKAGKAIGFIEGKIGELERWGKDIPARYMSRYQELSFDLHFVLGKAKTAAGLDKADVEAAFKQAYDQGTPSLSNCGSVLAWLLENGRVREYKKLVEVLNDNGKDYLKNVSAKAGKMSLAGRPQQAIKFIETNLASYSNWRKQHPDAKAASANGLPLMYFELAKAKSAVGASRQEVATDYGKTFVQSRDGYVQERAAALVWLLENDFKSEYSQPISLFARGSGVRRPYVKIAASVCRHFENTRKWDVFEAFLNSLLGEGDSSLEWAVFVESCLGNKRNEWARRYYEYIEKTSKERFGWDWDAEKLAAAGKYGQAAELYSHILKVNFRTFSSVLSGWS